MTHLTLNLLFILFTASLLLILVALWTAAWLHWTFSGEIRQFLFSYVFPESWRGGNSVEDILHLDHDDFITFLVVHSDAPMFVSSVLNCPGCLSAYVSGSICFLWLFVLIFFVPFSLWFVCVVALLMVWAGGAWIGHRLYSKF